ncbi:hypothetical protein BDC45DRAFT_609143 [Circinella umbellata]|nr:hypothetical protein BDC45DRAFT_609143 [Circinella umbellata]
MRTKIGIVSFEIKNDTQWDNDVVVLPQRLDMAYKQLRDFHEKELGGAIATKLNMRFNEVMAVTNSATFFATELMFLDGFAYLYNLRRVYYFLARKHAQIINPKGTTLVAILHHFDSYVGSKTKWFDLKNHPSKVLKYLPGVAPPPPPSTATTNKEELKKAAKQEIKLLLHVMISLIFSILACNTNYVSLSVMD